MSNLELFVNAYKQKRLSHLYLITGKKTLNKLELAYDISLLVLKDYDLRENLKEVIFNNEHTQVYKISPEGSSIKKEQIINLQKAFSKTSLVNGPRFYIIEDVDLISVQAANSLLKFMEEPENSSVYGILTSSNLQSVLPTITSRSQVVRMQDNENKVFEYLKENDVDNYLSYNISALTSDLEEANNYLNNESVLLIINYLKTYFNNFTNASYKAIVELNKSLTNIIVERNLYQIFLELMLFNYTDLLKYILNEKSIFSYDEIVKNISSENIIKDIKLIQEEIKRQNANININLSVDNLMLSLKKWV